MNPPAAFRASYSDWKLIRTRKVVQIVLEVPVEEADAAYQVLGGMPNPAESLWCAVARLDEKAEEIRAQRKLARHKRGNPRHPAWNELQPSAQVSILCGEASFRTFLEDQFPSAWNGMDKSWSSIERAIVFVRKHCGVGSRAEITSDNPQALDAWNRLEWDYRTWMSAPAAGAA